MEMENGMVMRKSGSEARCQKESERESDAGYDDGKDDGSERCSRGWEETGSRAFHRDLYISVLRGGQCMDRDLARETIAVWHVLVKWG